MMAQVYQDDRLTFTVILDCGEESRWIYLESEDLVDLTEEQVQVVLEYRTAKEKYDAMLIKVTKS